MEPYELLQTAGYGYAVVFLGYILFFSLVLVNIVTSVFLDRVMKFAEPTVQMVIDDRDRMERHDIRQLQDIFVEADLDHSGAISAPEFMSCVNSKKFGAFLAARGIDIHEAAAFFDLLLIHHTNNCEVDVVQAVKSCLRMKGYASSVDLQILRHEMLEQHQHLCSLVANPLPATFATEGAAGASRSIAPRRVHRSQTQSRDRQDVNVGRDGN
jgi:hypothetical protein